MDNFITSREQWLEEYKKDKAAIWVIVTLSDGKQIWFKDYDVWMEIKDLCEDNSLDVAGLSIQFKSHKEDTDLSGAEAVYLIRSLMGQMGGTTKYYYTVGKLIKGVMYKSMWLTPEIIEERKEEETIENCFEEAIIYNHGKRKKRKK